MICDVVCVTQSSDIHMISDSEGDDFEDAPEFGVDESEIFGMGSSGSRKSPMSEFRSTRTHSLTQYFHSCHYSLGNSIFLVRNS